MKKLSKYLVALLSVMFVAVVLMVTALRIAPEVRKKSDYETTRNRLDEAIMRKKRDIIDLRNKQQDFNADHEFVEYILHQNKRVWKNETVFVFEDEE